MPTAPSARRSRSPAISTPAFMRIKSASRPITATRFWSRAAITPARAARRSRRDQDIPLQRRCALQSGLHRSRQRARFRAAASRFSSEQAMGICFGRAAEQAPRLRPRRRHRTFSRAALHQGDVVRSQISRAARYRGDPRSSQRQVRLSHQPHLSGIGSRRAESRARRREQRRCFRHRPDDRRADAPAKPRRPRPTIAHLRH